jgi:hypothetical protein
MYGLIHNALKNMVVRDHGEPLWKLILESTEIEADVFLSMRQYDDNTTLTLIAASAKATNMEVEAFLEAFGFYWLTVFAPTDYGALLKLTGDDPFEFLRNLNSLHERISISFLEFRPPAFGVKHVSGILKGLPTMFNMSMVVELIERTEVQQGEQSRFRITKVVQQGGGS